MNEEYNKKKIEIEKTWYNLALEAEEFKED